MKFGLIKTLPFAVALMLGAASANAAIAVNSSVYTYSQSFDTLTTATTSTPWVNDSTLSGWSLFTANNSAVTNYYGGTGSSNSGAFYSFGSGSDRALGGLGSGGTYFGSPANGAVAGYIAVAFTNSTGAAISNFNIGFDGEQWRNGGNTSSQSMVMEYGFGTSFAVVSSWVAPGGNFDWASPVATSTAAAVDGNVAGLVGGRGGVLTPATNWGNGQTLWVRWIEKNDTGNDHGLAIDNFSLSVSAVPEADTSMMLLAGLGLMGFMARRRNSK